MENQICPYCGGKVVLRSSLEIYKRDYGYVWVCENYPNCDSYVGCHSGGTKALGTVADAELRELRIKVHNRLDPFWKFKRISRKKLYKKLEKIFGREIHMGSADKETCNKILAMKIDDIIWS